MVHIRKRYGIDPMIKVEGIDIHTPDGKILLEDISFEATSGSRLAFYGPNGCGKSTLLRYLAGIEKQNHNNGKKVILTESIYLPTQPLNILIPWLTVADNLKLFFSLATQDEGIDCQTLLAKYEQSLEYELSIYKQMAVYKLSSGQQALFAVFCAIIQNPLVLVADEIFSTLSEELRIKLADYLKNLNMIIIFATHDSDFISHLSAKTINLEKYIYYRKSDD